MSRVLFIEGNEDGTVGGSHKIQADLVRRLSSDFEPVVLFYQDNVWAGRLREAGLEVHTWDEIRRRERASYSSGGKLATLRTLLQAIALRRRFIREHGIDLVHLNNSPFIGVDDWLPASRLKRIPCVVYAMGDARRQPSRIRRGLMQNFDCVFPLSRFVENGLLLNGISPERIVLTYPGVDLEATGAGSRRDPKEVRREFGVSPESALAVMVGNVREWKGQHVVVEALAKLRPSLRSQIVVLLVGEAGPEHIEYRDRIERMIADAELSAVVRLTGRRSDVPDLLEAADIAIHASIRPEPFGLVVQEAMLSGCAVIAANEAGPAEMLTPESGLMYDTRRPEELSAHLERLITDPERRRSLGEGAKVRAREFDLKLHVELVEGAYRRLLSGSFR